MFNLGIDVEILVIILTIWIKVNTLVTPMTVIPFVKVYCFNNSIMAIFVANMVSDLELWSRRFFPKTFHPDANLKHQPPDS